MTKRRYITLVFEWTEAVRDMDYNNTELGPVWAMATGNMLTVNDILEEALGEIVHGSIDADEMAEEALDKAHSYVREQMDMPIIPKIKAGSPFAEPETQLDIEEAIAAKAGQ